MMQQALPRGAVIGCGYWGSNLARNFSDLGVLAAVCDENPAQARRLSGRYKARAYTVEDALGDTNIDAVAIATPAETHSAITEKALLAGKHVFVEKPVALDVGAAENLKRLSKQQARVLMVGHVLQYHPAFIRLKELVAQGELGRLRNIYSHRSNLGKARSEENILWSFVPHDASMVLSLVGDEPDRISAIGGFFLHSQFADVAAIYLSFRGGVNAHVFVSWLHPYKVQELVVAGDEGMAVFNDTREWEQKLTIYRHNHPRANSRHTRLFVISDGAQSFGAELNGNKVGTLAQITATSFFPAKPLGCYGDGGALFTDDSGIAGRLKSIRAHGKGAHQYDAVNVGINGRLDTIQAGILLEKLPVFPEEIIMRNQVADRYASMLENLVDIPAVREGCTSAWAQYTVKTDKRDAISEELKRKGIPTALHYPVPLHRQTACNGFPAAPGLSVSERLSSMVLSLPMHPCLEAEAQTGIADVIRQAPGKTPG